MRDMRGHNDGGLPSRPIDSSLKLTRAAKTGIEMAGRSQQFLWCACVFVLSFGV